MTIQHARLIPGLILIALGLVFLFAQYLDNVPGILLTMLGLVFLIAYVASRSYGLLIPGCILAGLGIGLLFDRPPLGTQVAAPIGLGLGFIAIFVVQLIVGRTSHWWPLVPGSILVLGGVAEAIPQAQELIAKGWPLILILIGLLIMAGQWSLRRTS
jgi:hypothetical protein